MWSNLRYEFFSFSREYRKESTLILTTPGSLHPPGILKDFHPMREPGS